MYENQIIPMNLRNSSHHKILTDKGFERIHQGKVRDTYEIPNVENCLFVVATDRISVFDFVLNCLIPQKGEVLTALTHFWLTNELKDYSNHLIPHFKLNQVPDEIKKRGLVVDDMRGKISSEIEFIFRGYIGGSVYKSYQETGKAGGHDIEPGLPQWSELKKPIFTPSTKAESGHDINITEKEYFLERKEKGLELEAKDFVNMLQQAYDHARRYARSRGIILLDTKFEGDDVNQMLGDEILTPDSARYSLIEDWEKTVKEGAPLISMDKQFVRNIINKVHVPGGKIGIKNLNPESAEDREFVHAITLPSDVIAKTTEIYKDLFLKLTRLTLENYQDTFLF